MISGLESVTSGKVYIEGNDVTNDPPAKRKVNTIFQNFALFPHMTVWENIEFGLKMNNIPENESNKRIKSAIKLVKLEGFESRYPKELSGGQQQRVAIARGIVMNHKVLLIDESLCSLDLKLKREMQIELKKIQKKLGITFIYVTHDQDEALTMSDRIVIINNGVIEQLGSPKEIYKNPKTVFAADFIGESDLIKSEIYKIEKGRAYLRLFDSIDITIPDNNYKLGSVLLVIRPENLVFQKSKTQSSFKGIINNYVYDGALVKLEVKVKEEILKINVYGDDDFEEGKEVYISIDTDKLIVIGDENEED